MTSLKKLLAVVAASLPLVASAQPAPEPPPAVPPSATPEGTAPTPPATPPTAAPATPPPTTPAPTPPAVSAKAGGITFKFSGDLNNRFNLFTDQAGVYAGSERILGATELTPRGTITDDTLEESWGEIKYRFQFEGSSENGLLKGVYNLELGAIRFGDQSTINGPAPASDPVGVKGGGYSGDGDNYETRFAYLDIGLPAWPKNRFTLGLQPFTVNKFLWSETAMGAQFKGATGPANLTLAWMRGREAFTANTGQEVTADGDNLLARGDFAPAKDLKLGAFVLYQHQNPETPGATFAHLLKRFSADTSYDIVNGGIDGALRFGDIFVNFDGIYQWGDLEGGLDLSAFLVHADVGIELGALKLTYTGWYASGDNTADTDVENFIATDVDMFDSVVLFEGGYTDDNYFTEAPYFLNFGAIFNKVAADFKVSPKLTLGAAAMYIMTAEDITLANPSASKENVLGTELDAFVSYKPMPQLELALNAGYLIAGDAMDRFETGAIAGNGKADADVFRSTARVRYQF